ncbi:hypothetical protein N9N28_01385 [Rubripirellula amarantea]|nr:hypothetical protein [Rubripirellula amarantea]
MNSSPQRQSRRPVQTDLDRAAAERQRSGVASHPHRCFALAIMGVLFSIALSALVFLGCRAAGRDSDLFPCLVSVVSAWGFASIVGRLSGRWLSVAVLISTCGSILLGKSLIGLQLLPDSSLREIMGGTATVTNASFCLLAPIVGAALAGMTEMAGMTDRWSGWSLDEQNNEGKRDELEMRDEPTVDARVPFTPIGWAAMAAWLLLVAVFYTIGGTGDRTGFRMITVPYDELSANQSLLGFSVSMANRPMMVETISAVDQVTWFAGGVRSDSNFRFLRSGYAFLAAQFSPICSPRNSLLVVNFLSWLVCLGVLWRLADRWFMSSVAAAFSVCIGAVGLGFGVLVNDTTPHLLSFAMYFVGIAMISEFSLGNQRQNWQTHLLFGLVFGSMSLAYNVAQMLLLVYLAVSFRTQRLAHLLAATSLALLFRPVLRWILPGLGINVVEVEGAYLSRAIDHWRESFEQGIVHFVGDVVRYTAEIVTSLESPWTLALGVLGLLMIRDRSKLWLCFMTIASPVAACLVFAPVATARGYVVFGASVVIYLGAGFLFANLIKRPGKQRVVAWLCLATVCLGQLAWTTSHYRGWTAPSKAFFLGWDQGSPLLTESPVLLNMTGNEPLPKVFGGNASFVDGGAIETALASEVFPRWLVLALLSRLPFVAAVLLVVNSLPIQRPTRRWSSGLIVVWFLITSLISFAVVDQQPFVFDCMNAIELGENEAMTYEVDVSEDVRREMSLVMAEHPDANIELYLGASQSVDVRWQADDKDVAIQQNDRGLRQVLLAKDSELISHSQRWKFSIAGAPGQRATLGGWQRVELQGRRLVSDGEAKMTLPGIEVRIRDRATGVLMLAVF